MLQLTRLTAILTLTDSTVEDDDGDTYRGVQVELLDGERLVDAPVIFARRYANGYLPHGLDVSDLVGEYIERQDVEPLERALVAVLQVPARKVA